MKKVITIITILMLSQIQAWALSCPLTSYESRKEYKYNGVRLVCDYHNGRLSSRFQQNGSETESIDYYSNGMPREYNLRSSNMGGGLYILNKRYNSSGMMVHNSLISGSYGYECTHTGGYRMKCVNYENGVGYASSVEYASQYEGN